MKLPRASDILTRPLFLLAGVALLVTLLLPIVADGIKLCGFYRLTGLPCFGCGMTRSLTSVAKLQLTQAWQFHPFGPILWPFMLLFAVAGLKKSWSQRLNNFFRQQDRIISPIFWGSLFCFFAFGTWRMFALDSYYGVPHLHPY